jgi:hypothetical protein
MKFQRSKQNQNTHEPSTFPNDELALMNARATARFDGEWGIELLTQANNMIYAVKDWAIRNLENIFSRSRDDTGEKALQGEVSDCRVHGRNGHQKSRESDK